MTDFQPKGIKGALRSLAFGSLAKRGGFFLIKVGRPLPTTPRAKKTKVEAAKSALAPQREPRPGAKSADSSYNSTFAGARGPGQAGVNGLKRRRPRRNPPGGGGTGARGPGREGGGGGAEHRQNTDVRAVRIGRHPRLPACHNFETVLQKGHAGPPDSNCTANPNAITPTESLSTMPGRPPLVEVACQGGRCGGGGGGGGPPPPPGGGRGGGGGPGGWLK